MLSTVIPPPLFLSITKRILGWLHAPMRFYLGVLDLKRFGSIWFSLARRTAIGSEDNALKPFNSSCNRKWQSRWHTEREGRGEK